MNAGLSLAAALLAAVSLATCGRVNKPLLGETTPGAPVTESPAQKNLAPAELAAAELPAGAYVLDPLHSTLVFKVSHLGFSDYVGQFGKFDASLHLDPASPANATLTATIDPGSLHVPSPPEGFLDELKGPKWLDTVQFPQMTFKSTRVEMVTPETAKIIGDLTLHGVTRTIELRARFNGGYASHPYDQQARVGFSANASFNRSDFGVSNGVPAPGSKMGVGDKIDVMIEVEFSGPAVGSAQTPETASTPG